MSGLSSILGTTPNFYYGFVPTPAQWTSYFSGKQDALGYTAFNRAGDTMQGLFITQASSGTQASINITIGISPISPNNGDLWSDANGLYFFLNGKIYNLIAAQSAAPSTGVPDGSTFLLTAAVNIPAFSVVRGVGGSSVNLASSGNADDQGNVIGLTLAQAQANTNVLVINAGEVVNAAWAWSEGPVYLGLNGSLTQFQPTTGFVQQIGVAVGPSTIVVGLSPAVALV